VFFDIGRINMVLFMEYDRKENLRDDMEKL